MTKIKAILRIIRPTTYTGEGAFTYTDTETGKMVEARTSSPDNISHVTRCLTSHGGWEGNDEPRTYVTREEMKAREFARFVKDLPHVGSQPEEFAKFIQAELAK